MRKIIISLIFLVLLGSFVSADIIIQGQPKELYNLGDTIEIPLKIVALENIKNTFSMNILCNGVETEVYKADIKLSLGQEQSLNLIIILDKSRIGKTAGICKIKASLKDSYVLTNEFKISDLIVIELKNPKLEFTPGENIIIEGEAKKENGELVNGFVELSMTNQGKTIEKIDTVNNGFFYLNLSLEKNAKAGEYLVLVKVYEKDSNGDTTNNGFTDYNIKVKQIPTSIEIIFENPEINPGDNLKVKAILHDQTGEKIDSNVIITIKNDKNKIFEQVDKSTDEFLEFPIKYNEPPADWKIFAVSNKLSSESTFKINEKQDIKIELINRTLIVKNTGNVPYKKTLLIKIGDKSMNIDINLDVNENEKYILSAPDGEYKIEVIGSEGESKMTGMSVLTGDAIDIKKASGSVVTLVRHPFVWFFIIGILGFVVFMVLKKGYKRSFIGYIHTGKKEKSKEIIPSKKSIINASNIAELSLSIKGDKQNVSLVCLKLKNFEEIEKSKEGTKETLQKISNIAEENKTVVYKNHDNLFLILAPIMTKTFKNEKTAVEIAQKIQKILKEHNRMFKQRIEFGISLNYGTIVAKQEQGVFKFMSMDTLISASKKIASISNEEIYLSEKIREKLMSDVKTEKTHKDKITIYTIKDIRSDNEEHKKFIRSFLDRVEREK